MKTQKQNKYYYGFHHYYGANVQVQGAPNGDGGRLFVFSSKADRDEWVGEQTTTTVHKVAYPASQVRPHVTRYYYYGAGVSDVTTRALVDEALRCGIFQDMTND